MSICQDLTYISVIGDKESIIRMLNAAIRNVGTGDVILDCDSIETINSKIREEGGKYTLRIAIPDLLDEKCQEDSLLMEKWNEYEKNSSGERNRKEELEQKRDRGEELTEQEWDELAMIDMGEEESCSCRMIDLETVCEKDGKYVVDLHLYECEGGYYSDWLDWGDIARLYGCKVVIDNDLYKNGNFIGNCGTIIYETMDGEVQKTKYEPEVILDKFNDDYDALIKMNPDTYRSRKIRDLDYVINMLQYELSQEKMLIARDEVESNNGVFVVPDGVKYISYDAFSGIKQKLKKVVIPASLEDFSLLAFSGCDIESIEIDPANTNFCSVDNCILSADRTRLIIGCKTSIIPDTVVEIGTDAFSGCKDLSSISLPANLKTIGRDVPQVDEKPAVDDEELPF